VLKTQICVTRPQCVKNKSLRKTEKPELSHKAQTCNLHEMMRGAGAVQFMKSGTAVLRTERSVYHVMS
jgi:hypothetical protein